MKLPILTYVDPLDKEILRSVGRKIRTIDDTVKALIADMWETLYEEPNGVGLSAHQVGKAIQITVIDTTYCERNGLKAALINPVMVPFGRYAKMNEWCLSFPGLKLGISRPAEVYCTYTAEDGAQERIKTDGILARVIQHEVDHCYGKLFIDRIQKSRGVAYHTPPNFQLGHHEV